MSLINRLFIYLFGSVVVLIVVAGCKDKKSVYSGSNSTQDQTLYTQHKAPRYSQKQSQSANAQQADKKSVCTSGSFYYRYDSTIDVNIAETDEYCFKGTEDFVKYDHFNLIHQKIDSKHLYVPSSQGTSNKPRYAQELYIHVLNDGEQLTKSDVATGLAPGVCGKLSDNRLDLYPIQVSEVLDKQGKFDFYTRYCRKTVLSSSNPDAKLIRSWEGSLVGKYSLNAGSVISDVVKGGNQYYVDTSTSFKHGYSVRSTRQTEADQAASESQICKSVGDSKINLGKTSNGEMLCEGEGTLLKDGASISVDNSVGSISGRSLRSTAESKTMKKTSYTINRSDLLTGAFSLSCPDENGEKVIKKETIYLDGDTVVSKEVGFFDENGGECTIGNIDQHCTAYDFNPDQKITLSSNQYIRQIYNDSAKLNRTYSIGSNEESILVTSGRVFVCEDEK